jgi:transcriptional antiterminator RfaH
MTVLISTDWLVAQTRPSFENKAARHLANQGYEVYLPRYLKRRHHARKTDYVAAPLFPRYLFVGADLSAQRWRPIQSTFGVTRLVTNGERPVLVPEGVVRSLVLREDDKGFIKMERGVKFSPGEKVRIVSGAFTDNFGFFECSGERDRVAILLDLLGQKVRVVLDADCIAVA